MFILIIHIPRVYSQENTILQVDSISLRNNYLNEMQSINVLKHKPIEVSEDLVRSVLDKQAPFAVYKDNYMVTGIPLNKSVTRKTADAFFQFSIRHRVTRSVLPFNSFLYITYSQKSFWDIYDESSPFSDTNYNPGIGIGRYVIKDNKLKGAMMISLEHESNGKAGEDSRSWNYINLSAKYFYNMRLSAKAQIYLPYVDGGNNKDLLRYKGYGIFSVNYIDKENLWWFSLNIIPRDKIINPNLHTSLSFRVSKISNQYLTLDYYAGYGEGLLNYKKYTNQVRIGFTIKPDFFSAY
ncbi:phospholipase A [Dysgonomonas mossii]|uniref:Phosphatidylcholine 1-acylhydrolase n=1 Tax=Dysgonomonas mossii TaxID=163665 RepID=A0A4Y9ISB4_9BACT|nr:phospholipase A [Dysgonomonas mossii]TFU91463.1 phospholipase [Dysgonomonas mossii]